MKCLRHATTRGAVARGLMVAMLVMFNALFSGPLHAQSGKPLPAYVIEAFGEPPAVPEGPLAPAMQFALRVAFVDSVVLSTWDENQSLALAEIAASGDPRPCGLPSRSGAGEGRLLAPPAALLRLLVRSA